MLSNDPLLSFISEKVLPVTQYRPGLAVYPQVSQALQQATADIVSGKWVDEAAAAYQGAVEGGRRRRQGPEVVSSTRSRATLGVTRRRGSRPTPPGSGAPGRWPSSRPPSS